MEYAVIENNGKIYKISENKKIKLDKIQKPINSKITFEKVLVIKKNNKEIIIGQPYIKKTIEAVIIDHKIEKKIKIIKHKRRKNHLKKLGFRKQVTIAEIIT
jgi:large subunit ribosomal protein L21